MSQAALILLNQACVRPGRPSRYKRSCKVAPHRGVATQAYLGPEPAPPAAGPRRTCCRRARSGRSDSRTGRRNAVSGSLPIRSDLLMVLRSLKNSGSTSASPSASRASFEGARALLPAGQRHQRWPATLGRSRMRYLRYASYNAYSDPNHSGEVQRARSRMDRLVGGRPHFSIC